MTHVSRFSLTFALAVLSAGCHYSLGVAERLDVADLGLAHAERNTARVYASDQDRHRAERDGVFTAARVYLLTAAATQPSHNPTWQQIDYKLSDLQAQIAALAMLQDQRRAAHAVDLENLAAVRRALRQARSIVEVSQPLGAAVQSFVDSARAVAVERANVEAD